MITFLRKLCKKLLDGGQFRKFLVYAVGAIRSSELEKHINAELNFAEFVIERQIILLGLASDLLNNIIVEQTH